MVLASTPECTSVEKLADLANKVMEVSTPSVAAVATSPAQANEVEHLQEEVSAREVGAKACKIPLVLNHDIISLTAHQQPPRILLHPLRLTSPALCAAEVWRSGTEMQSPCA